MTGRYVFWGFKQVPCHEDSVAQGVAERKGFFEPTPERKRPCLNPGTRPRSGNGSAELCCGLDRSARRAGWLDPSTWTTSARTRVTGLYLRTRTTSRRFAEAVTASRPRAETAAGVGTQTTSRCLERAWTGCPLTKGTIGIAIEVRLYLPEPRLYLLRRSIYQNQGSIYRGNVLTACARD